MSSPKSVSSAWLSWALVDSERILTQLRTEGYEVTPEYNDADVVVVNTCGFIDSAKAESLEAIGEAIAEKRQGHRDRLHGRGGIRHPAGAPQRAGRDRTAAVRGSGARGARRGAAPPGPQPVPDLVPPQGVKLTPRHYAYLKISEGCNHRCSFCIIPSMRGDLVSRPVGDVLSEAERWSGPASRNCWSSRRTPAPMAWTSNTAAVPEWPAGQDAHDRAVRRAVRAGRVDPPALRLSVSGTWTK